MTVRRNTRGRAIAVLITAVLTLSTIGVLPAFGAASNYTPSVVEAPAYVLNDHTPFGVRFAVAAGSGLTPSTEYYVKIRIANTNSRTTWDQSKHRGFTYDPVANHWEQERDDWVDCPTVTTDATGALGNTWVYAKIGDENASGAYFVHVALSATGDSSTFNPTVVPAITVLNTKTEGSWIHNGTELATLDGKRVGVLASDGDTTGGDSNARVATLYALWEAQENGVDDDSNGLVDAADPNENYGLATSNLGDYRVGTPLSTLMDVYVNRTNLRNNDFTTGTQADCDIAVPTDAGEGTADVVAPGSVTDLAATVGASSIDLTWTAASDNGGGSGIGGYRIYRWMTPATPDPVPYTPVPVCIGAVAAGVTTFSDTTAAYDVEYAYEVRATDVSTNVGPRSSTVTGAVAAPPVVLAPVYRFYNFTNNTHFFTDSAAEKDMVLATWPHIYRLDGVAYSTAPANNTQPLYRFYNKVSGSHFYTASLDEANMILATWPHIFTLDGQTYKVNPTEVPGSVPVYRFFNLRNGSHFYTSSTDERDMVLATWPTIYRLEGPAFWISQ